MTWLTPCLSFIFINYMQFAFKWDQKLNIWCRFSGVGKAQYCYVKIGKLSERQFVPWDHIALVAYGSGKRMVTGTRAGSRIKTRNFKQRFLPHHTSRSAAIFGVQGGRSYLVLALTLWIGLCPMKRSSGVWNFGDVSVTYRRSFGNHTLAGPYVPVTYYRNRL